ncbi:MAG TPA: DinB family protein [Micromonosporaceae bacterium]|jgi:hypothetical protein
MAVLSFACPDERQALSNFLDQQREGLIRKLDGVSDVDARRTPTVSALSLLGLIKHSAAWERRWFQVIVAGRVVPDGWPNGDDAADDERDDTFDLDDEDTVESVLADYREQIAGSREVLASLDLDARCGRTEIVDTNLRWVAHHMIEETARHAGHADIVRETIDGRRGMY